jgi:hypothetical protein
MIVGQTVYDQIASELAAHFAAGWEITGYDWPEAAPEIPALTVFPGGHDSFIVSEGFGIERVSWSLSVWLPVDDERRSLTQFYAMAATRRELGLSFVVDGVVSGVEWVRVLEPRIVSTPERSALIGQFDIALSVSTC